MRVAAIIPAAGSGRRMGSVPKAFLEVAGKPLLQYSVDVLLNHPAIETIIVALSPEAVDGAPPWLRQPEIRLVNGGDTRAASVRAGLYAVPDGVDTILVHDAARPLLNAALIDRVLAAVDSAQSATIGVPVTDTVHEADSGLNISATRDRTQLWRAQTPQAFPREVLELAFARTTAADNATDEAGLVAAGGWPVRLVAGEEWNIKVTTPADIARAESLLRERED